MNLLLNLLVFLVLPVIIIILIKRNNDSKAKFTSILRIRNIREDWVYYRALILNEREELEKYAHDKSNAINTFKLLDLFYEHASYIDELLHSFENSKGTCDRGIIIKALLENYELKNIGNKVSSTKGTLEKACSKYDKDKQLMLILSGDQLNVICHVKGNTVIGILGKPEEITFNPDLHKVWLVAKAVERTTPEEEEEDDDTN